MAGTDEESIDVDVDALEGSAWSVARLNAELDAVLTDAIDRFPTYVYGEISDVNSYDFGTFFELRDIDDEAVISCIAWSQSVATFEQPLEEGTAAIVRASVDFHAERGNTQLVVADYWPAGDSARTQELEQLRSQLESEGLLAEERKRPLPEYPECIGVVTSLSGSAREDFVSSVRARAAGVTIKLCGATVQGENAVPSLVGAIQRLERDSSVDIIVVTRGGGSDADLWCFNEEPVVRAIADASTPVVVAIGHEDDETLAEAVADRRAMTPTDAGVATTPNMDSVRQSVTQVERRVESAYAALAEERLVEYQHRIETAYSALEQQIAAQTATQQRLTDLDQRIASAYTAIVETRLTTLDQRIDTAVRDIEHAAETDAVTAQAVQGRVSDLEARIDRAYQHRVDQELSALDARIDNAYREMEADAKIEAGTAEARRLRIVVAILIGLLLLGAALVVLLLI